MTFKDSRFSKPSASSPGCTQHLYIAGIGEQLGTSRSALVAFFSSFGPLDGGDDGIYMPQGKRFVFVSFQDIKAAQGAYDALIADPVIAAIGAHHLQVQYAVPAKQAACPPEAAADDTSATDLALIPENVEQQHVHDVYDSIAAHWHHTRGKRKVHWARVKHFLLSLSPGSLVADVGCGDGKYFGLNPNVQVVGCDYSQRLLEVSKLDGGGMDYSHESFACDALHLPFLSSMFDATMCIAVLHHISSADRRLQVLSELIRITSPGGHIFIQAWAQEQSAGGRVFATQDVFVPWKLNRRYSSDGQDVVYNRYCHVYKEGELEKLVAGLPVRIEEGGYDCGNWFLHLIKE